MAGAGNTINYLSLGCQMFSTIISYNKSFNSAANQIKWSTFRKCCHCILVWEHQLSRENHFTHKFSMSYKCQSCLRWNNESLKYWRGGVFWDETWFPSCIIFTKKAIPRPRLCTKIDSLVIFWWEGSVQGPKWNEIRSISISRVSVSVVFIHGWAPPSGLICSFSFIAAAQPEYWFQPLPAVKQLRLKNV